MKLRKYLLRVYKLIPNNCQLCQINKKYIYLNQKIGILANWKQLKTTAKLSAWWTYANLTRKVKTKRIWILLNSKLLRTIYAQKGTNKVLKPTWKTNKRLKCRPHVKISLMAGRKQLSPRLRKMLFTFNRKGLNSNPCALRRQLDVLIFKAVHQPAKQLELDNSSTVVAHPVDNLHQLEAHLAELLPIILEW